MARKNELISEIESMDPPAVDDGTADPQVVSEESADNGAPPAKEGFMKAARSKALRPFVIISSSYLLFTITDGAIRMIVLLHAYNKAFSALQVAFMFTLYELAGVFTNLVSFSATSIIIMIVEDAACHELISPISCCRRLVSLALDGALSLPW